jgi:hypothetical protein
MSGMPDQNSQPSKNVLGVPFWKIFIVPLACYVPAFLLVLMSYALFKPTSTFAPNSGIANPTGEIKKEPDLRKSIKALDTSELAREYIRKEIETEVKKQSDQAAKDEVEKLKADWKGDLFGQVAFPVVFAIASIFAAFAVKDILTEILKEQEKERIRQELCKLLEDQIVPDAVKVGQESFSQNLQAIEGYIYWLEHELSRIEITRIVDDLEISNSANSKVGELSLLALEKLFIRLSSTLSKTSHAFAGEDLKQLRKSECQLLEARVGKIGLSHEKRIEILSKLHEKNEFYESKDEKNISIRHAQSQHMEEIFEAQIRLLAATLGKLIGDDSIPPQLKADIQETIAEVSRNPRREYDKAKQEFDRSRQGSNVKRPSFE